MYYKETFLFTLKSHWNIHLKVHNIKHVYRFCSVVICLFCAISGVYWVSYLFLVDLFVPDDYAIDQQSDGMFYGNDHGGHGNSSICNRGDVEVKANMV